MYKNKKDCYDLIENTLNVNLFNEQIMTDHEIKISIAKDMLWVLFNLKETLIF